MFVAKSTGYQLLGTVGYSGLTIFSAAVLAFLACALSGVAVIWVRFMEGMLSPTALGRITEDLLDAALEPAAIQVSMENWYRTQSATWTGIISSQAKAMIRKSRRLLTAQRLLVGGLIATSIFSILVVTSLNLDLIPHWIRGILSH